MFWSVGDLFGSVNVFNWLLNWSAGVVSVLVVNVLKWMSDVVCCVRELLLNVFSGVRDGFPEAFAVTLHLVSINQ